MKHFKKSFTLLVLLTATIGSQTFAQDSIFVAMLELAKSDRTKEVLQDNEYTSTGYEQGNFYNNPLLLNGKPLDYDAFTLESKGELTLIKGAPLTSQTVQVPFFVYLRRDGNKIFIPGKESPNQEQLKIDISEIFKYAKPGDQLVIEPVRKEDGPAKRILKLMDGHC